MDQTKTASSCKHEHTTEIADLDTLGLVLKCDDCGYEFIVDASSDYEERWR